jgi:sarcosine oxidase subunit beta
MKLNRSSYDVAIVGAGVIGLYLAHHLSEKMDPRKILVVDNGFLSGGASGRNGGGVRQQWETLVTIRLARESVSTYRRFGKDFGFNPWFRQGGYLFLSFNDEETAELRRVGTAVRSEGLPVKWLDNDQIHKLVPALNLDGLQGASYLSSDGVLLPFPVLWGLAASLKRRGVELQLHTRVTGVQRTGNAVSGIVTQGGNATALKVVNAAGGWSKEVNTMAGLDSPNKPTLHEILATEPLKPFLKPMVTTLNRGIYFSQTMRGEVVGGLPVEEQYKFPNMPSSIDFLVKMSRELVRLVPSLRPVRILRAWSGYYDDTPDGLPILGEDPRLRGFFQANGFGGHGFMIAPASTRRLAQMILGEKIDLDPSALSPGRFLNGGAGPQVDRLQLG